MFTGIVQGIAEVIELNKTLNAQSFTLQFPEGFCKGLKIGASVAVNGTCLTVVSVNEEKSQCNFDMISTTLELTNLSEVVLGSKVNVERSYKVGDEVGGHILSGHIDTKIPVVSLVNKDNIYQLEFSLPQDLKPFILDKGFVGLDGMSLTVSSITEKGFTVNLIPETLAKTTVANKKVGDYFNLEVCQNTRAIINILRSSELLKFSKN